MSEENNAQEPSAPQSKPVRKKNPLTGTNTDPLGDRYDLEAIAAADKPIVQVTGDAWERHLMKVAAAASVDDLEEPNQFDVTASAYRATDPDGKDYAQYELRYLNPRMIDEHGLGFRGWEPVTDPHGRQVTVARQILSRMPKEKAIKRRYHRSALAKERIAAAQERQQEAVARAARDSGGAVGTLDAQKMVFGDSR